VPVHPVPSPSPSDPPPISSSNPTTGIPGFLPPSPLESGETRPREPFKPRFSQKVSSAVDRFFEWWDERFRYFSFFLSRLFRLDVYGDSLKTPRVASELDVFAAILFFQLIVDFWAWRNAWDVSLPDSGIPIPGTEEFVSSTQTDYGTEEFSKYLVLKITPIILGLIFALAILLVDRSIIVADTTTQKPNKATPKGFSLQSGTKSLIARVLLIGLISAVTAVPVELSIFKPEIESRIDGEEKKAIDEIRERGIKTERERSEKEIGAATSASQTSLDALTIEQNLKRTQLKETLDKERAPLTEAVARFDSQASYEAVGNGRSKMAGAGPIYKELLRQGELARARLDKFNLDAAARTDRLNEQLEAEKLRQEGIRDTRLGDERGDLKNKIDHIRTMPPQEVAALYGGTWKQPRGFLARYAALQKVTSESWSQRAIAWGCRIVMVLFGIIVLTLKLQASEEFKRYCSFSAQVSGGQPQARNMAEGMGYTLSEEYGLDAASRDQLFGHTEKVMAISERLDDFQKQIFINCRKRGHGLCEPYNQIVAILHHTWVESVQPELDGLTRYEHGMKLAGIGIPAWPAHIRKGQDPRGRKALWDITAQELETTYGWENPNPTIMQTREAANELPTLQAKLQEALSSYRAHELRLVVANPLIARLTLINERSQYWERIIQPILSRLGVLERSLESYGIKLPEWPKGFPDPRENLEQAFSQPNLDQLEDMDWRGRNLERQRLL